MPNFYTIWTDRGRAKEAAALAGGARIEITHVAVGDGGGAAYDPVGAQTALVGERWRGAPNLLAVDELNPSWVRAEAYLPANVGGWTVREAGLIDSAGDLVAIAKLPETYKPVLAEGSGKDLLVRLILEVVSSATVTLKIDPAVVLATRGYAETKAASAESAAKTYADARSLGFAQDGEHDAYTGDLDTIARNSLFAAKQGTATHLPADLEAGAWAFCQTMILPGDAGRTQLVWSVEDPDRSGWWRRRAAGVWGEWERLVNGSEFDAHATSTSNPHVVTADQVGAPPSPATTAGALGEWKKISSATGAALFLPAGGTWAWLSVLDDRSFNASGANALRGIGAGISAGGAQIAPASSTYQNHALVWRIA